MDFQHASRIFVQMHKFIPDRVCKVSRERSGGQPGTIEIGPIEPREGNAPGAHNRFASERSLARMDGALWRKPYQSDPDLQELIDRGSLMARRFDPSPPMPPRKPIDDTDAFRNTMNAALGTAKDGEGLASAGGPIIGDLIG